MGKISRTKYVFHININFGIIYTFISGLNWKNNKLKIFTWWHILYSIWIKKCKFRSSVYLNISRSKYVFHITIYFGIIYTFTSVLNWKNNNKLKIFTWWLIPYSTWICIFKEIQILNISNHIWWQLSKYICL